MTCGTATSFDLGFGRPDGGDAQRLRNLAPYLPEDERSRKFRGRGELIDHILASHALVHPITRWSWRSSPLA